MADDSGWLGSSAQVVHAASGSGFGGGSSGGAGAGLDDSDYDDQIAFLGQRITDLTAAVSQDIKGLRADLASLTTFASNVNQRVTRLTSDVSNSINSVGDRVTQLTADASASINKVGDRVTQLTSDVTKTIDQLKYQDTVNSDRITKLTDAVSSSVGAVGDRVTQLTSDVTKSLAAANARTDDLSDQVQHLSPQVQSLAVAVADLTDSVGESVSGTFDSLGIIKAITDFNSDFIDVYVTKFDDYVHSFGDLKILLDDVLQKILDKLILIQNTVSGDYAERVKFWDKFHADYFDLQTLWAGRFDDWQTTQTKMLLALSNWLQAIFNTLSGLHLDAPPSGDESSGSGFWDFLGKLADLLAKLLEAIASLAKTLADLLMGLFVPKDLSFITDSMSGLSDKFHSKFSVFFGFSDSVRSVFGSRRSISDFSFVFDKKSVSIDLSWLRTIAAMVRPYATGVFLISSLVALYRRVTGGDVVQ